MIGTSMAQSYGLNLKYTYSEQTFRIDFARYIAEHNEIFDQPRGFGYWLWKPYLINYILNNINEGDFLIYADAGILFIRDPQPLIDLCDQKEQLFFALPGENNSKWTKRDLFQALKVDTPDCWQREQATGQCSVWKCCESSRKRVAQWLKLCEDPRLLTDIPSQAENRPDFVDHRHDQSILSILTYLWGYELVLNPSQVGMDDVLRQKDPPYPQISLAVGILERHGHLAHIWKYHIEPALTNAHEKLAGHSASDAK